MYNHKFCLRIGSLTFDITVVHTVVPGFRVLEFPEFRALKAGDGAWSVHKTLFGFSAPVFQQKK